MSKKKKKGEKHQTLYKAVKPFIKDNRVVLALFGAVGFGVALAKAIGPDRAGNLVDGITATIKHLTQHSPEEKEEKKSKAPNKNKSLQQGNTDYPTGVKFNPPATKTKKDAPFT